MRKLLNLLLILVISSLIMASSTFANTGTLKDTDFLNVRENPSTSANIVTVLPENASFDILSEEGDWYKIKYQNTTGYVSKQYVSVSEVNTNSNIPAEPNSNGIVNKNSTLYVLPLLNSTILDTLNNGTKVLVVSINGKWAYIQTETASGWIFTDNISGTEESNISTSDDNENGNNKVENSIDNSISDNSISENVENNTIEDTNSNMEDNNIDTQNDNTSNYPKTMYVNVDAVYIRAKSTTESDVVASVGLNTPVTVKGEEGEWYKVSVTDGDGYMMKKYLSESKN